jgi:uncharacterized membrane protein YcjF (UPF0283 family)
LRLFVEETNKTSIMASKVSFENDDVSDPSQSSEDHSSEREGHAVDSVEAIAAKEKKALFRSRVLAGVLLVMTAAVAGIVTYVVTYREGVSDFEVQVCTLVCAFGCLSIRVVRCRSLVWNLLSL